MTFKVVTLVKRKAGLSVEAFQEHWRERHAPLVASRLRPARYVVSAALPQGYGKGELLFDGISEMWFASKGAFDAPAPAEITADEEGFLDLLQRLLRPLLLPHGFLAFHLGDATLFLRLHQARLGK